MHIAKRRNPAGFLVGHPLPHRATLPAVAHWLVVLIGVVLDAEMGRVGAFRKENVERRCAANVPGTHVIASDRHAVLLPAVARR